MTLLQKIEQKRPKNFKSRLLRDFGQISEDLVWHIFGAQPEDNWGKSQITKYSSISKKKFQKKKVFHKIFFWQSTLTGTLTGLPTRGPGA